MRDEDNTTEHLKNKSQASDDRHRLYAEQVKLLYAQASVSMIATLANSTILTFILWKVISHTILLAWFSCNLLITLIRYLLVYRYRCTSSKSLEIHRWGSWFTVGLACGGIVWGLAGIFLFPVDSIAHQVFLAFVLGGMVAGAVGSYSVIMRVFLIYMLPISIPINVRFFAQGGDIHAAMGVMVLLFIIIMIGAARRMNASILSSLKLRFENTDLIDYLATEKKRVDKLNEKLQYEITERKRSEEALWGSEMRYRAIVEDQTELICRFKPDCTLTFVNEAYARYWGKTPEEMIGTSFVALIPESGKETTLQYFDSFSLGKPIKVIEHEVLTPDRGIRWQQWSDRAFFDDQGNIRDFQSAGRDITDRKRAEGSLRESEQLLRATLESTADGILVVDERGIVTHTNGRFAEMWKIPEKLLKAKEDRKLLDYVQNQLKEPQAFLSGVEELYKTQRVSIDTLFFKDGRIFERVSSPLIRDGRMAGRVWSFRDITHKKLLQDQLTRSERLAATGQLAASIAHEINSPLQGITVMLSMMKSKCEANKVPSDDINLLKGAFGSIKNTVRNLLDLNRPGTEVKQPTNVNNVIERTVDLVRSHLKKSKIRVNLDFSSAIPNITASPQQLSHVFLNLINNAIEATSGGSKPKDGWRSHTSMGGEINIETNLRRGDVVIKVSDTGPGIPEEDLNYIFDPFYTRKKEMGMGVGLSICHGIIVDNNGTIEAKNSPEGGAIFTITLPAS